MTGSHTGLDGKAVNAATAIEKPCFERLEGKIVKREEVRSRRVQWLMGQYTGDVSLLNLFRMDSNDNFKSTRYL